jgi:hypothetical protein
MPTKPRLEIRLIASAKTNEQWKKMNPIIISNRQDTRKKVNFVFCAYNIHMMKQSNRSHKGEI